MISWSPSPSGPGALSWVFELKRLIRHKILLPSIISWFFIVSQTTMSRFAYIVALFFLSWAVGAHALPQHDSTKSFVNQLNLRALPVGTCNSNTPCANGACCGSNNLCGYSPTECGTGCTSNCNATAECGQYGTPGQQNCPLDVCCSQFGSVKSKPHFPG